MKTKYLTTLGNKANEVVENINIDFICNSLQDLGLIDSSKQIKFINEIKEEDRSSDRSLTIESTLSFYEFSKKKIFELEPQMCLSYEGEICAYWKFPNRDRVSIEFLKNKKLKYFIRSSNKCYSDTTTIDNIFQVLLNVNILEDS